MKRNLYCVVALSCFLSADVSVGDMSAEFAARPVNSPGLGWIKDGETKVGTISQWSKVDAAKFSASSGEVVNIRITPLSTPLAPKLALYDPTGALVGETRGNDGYATGILEPRLTKTGQYTIRVTEYDVTRTGTYAVSMARLTPGHGLAGEPGTGLITNGATRQATLAQWADMDTARFSVISGQVARITMARSESTNTLTSHVALYDPNGRQVSYTCADNTAVLSNRLTSTGTYTIRCMDYYGSRKGNYQVGLTLYPVQ